MNMLIIIVAISNLEKEKNFQEKHYKEKEEWPTMGFSPDADFPCIYAEKCISTVYLKEDFSKYENFPIFYIFNQ